MLIEEMVSGREAKPDTMASWPGSLIKNGYGCYQKCGGVVSTFAKEVEITDGRQ